MSFAKIISIFDWLKDKLPIQDRKERWKNELDNFQKERNALLKKPASRKASARINLLDTLIEQRVQWLKNAQS